MKDKLNTFCNFINNKLFTLNYLFPLLGFGYAYLFIYFQFIRERIPKDIPWELNEFRFYILVYICLIYIYVIKNLLFPKQPNFYFLTFFKYITTPFVSFDFYIKYNSYLKTYYKKLSNIFIEKYIQEWGTIERIFFIYMFQIFPRIILVFIFLTDIFLLHKIEIYYYFIFLGFTPLIYNYIIYSLTFDLEMEIKKLEEKYSRVWMVLEDEYWLDIDNLTINQRLYHDTYVSIRMYLEIKIELFFDLKNIYNDVEYKGIPIIDQTLAEIYKKKHNIENLTDFDLDILQKEFILLSPKLIALTLYLRNNKITPTMFYIPEIKLGIYIIHFSCWMFILSVSIYVFPPTFEYTLIFLNNMLDNLIKEELFYFSEAP